MVSLSAALSPAALPSATALVCLLLHLANSGTLAPLKFGKRQTLANRPEFPTI